MWRVIKRILLFSGMICFALLKVPFVILGPIVSLIGSIYILTMPFSCSANPIIIISCYILWIITMVLWCYSIKKSKQLMYCFMTIWSVIALGIIILSVTQNGECTGWWWTPD